ncbi:YiiX/YebB-like N1pC/P60 family cysteine hydrolase [Serratia sp. UGAL515B_01]|uniref:YiiX/YebB-like N1pC/P60 family cysteine hydrolase n=1 Tax=Serratia sp. UGAL515B_01 TaxID=2986763 RepID=UPI002953293A|nr:YiiX/YebB-like N1pC/P60 family cysteine hydrolase [Serratia sp. UGAL515B_01]WON76377.1 YiiX/YebB-like N1pC/P60 family cysteine hydrolase [Serratia sp. UGAL515B_01]
MFKQGDLIFTQIGSASNAISAVTEGYRGARVNHVGVIVVNNRGTFVLEAFPPEVRVTSLSVFLRRSEFKFGKPRYILTRLHRQFRSLIPNAIQYGLEQRNRPYDQLYLTETSALYCSELIVDMFRYANGGNEFFVEQPMSFHDPASGKILPVWIEYYAKFGMNVPQGQPGSNPGSISKDERLSIIEIQGPPSGYI